MSDNTSATSIDESFYKLDDEELLFFKAQTGIDDEAELKSHILRVAAEAHSVFQYGCIRVLAFTKLTVSKTDAYEALVKIKEDMPGALFLDLGCCFGNDVRKVVSDGWPIDQCVASDLRPEFWALGHKLFNSTPENFPVKFIPGNIFDPSQLTIRHYGAAIESIVSRPRPQLEAVHSLNDLHGRVSVIHCSNVFHLFDEPSQLHLARALSGLLSPFPGSLIFGMHVTRGPEKGNFQSMNQHGFGTFCHSPESWAEMWNEVFGSAVVKVDARLVEIDEESVKKFWGDVDEGRLWRMIWSVTVI